jgi:hypothetical protein
VNAEVIPVRPRGRHVKFLETDKLKNVDVRSAGGEVHPMTDAGDVGEEEAQEAMRRTPAKLPSDEEVRAHNVSHLPFRDWCPDCVAGRAKDWPHKTWREVEKLEHPEIHMDYCFPRDAAVAQAMAQDLAQTSAQTRADYAVVLVGRDRETKMTFAHVVPHKGAEQEWVCEQVVRDMRKFGIHGKVSLKTDQEPAIRDLALGICKPRGEARTLEELAPVGDSRGNGVAERGVQAVEEMIRVHKLSLERDAWGSRCLCPTRFSRG